MAPRLQKRARNGPCLKFEVSPGVGTKGVLRLHPRLTCSVCKVRVITNESLHAVNDFPRGVRGKRIGLGYRDDLPMSGSDQVKICKKTCALVPLNLCAVHAVPLA